MALKQRVRLQRPHLPIVALGHVEDDDVRVELRSGVAIDRTSSVMLELRRDKLPGCLGRIVATDAGLRISLQLIQGDIDGLAVCLAHAGIAADKRSQNLFKSLVRLYQQHNLREWLDRPRSETETSVPKIVCSESFKVKVRTLANTAKFSSGELNEMTSSFSLKSGFD